MSSDKCECQSTSLSLEGGNMPADVDVNKTASNVAVIRTSDRSNFKRCRRAWAFQSHMKMNLEPVTAAKPLIFGTGIHYALEDYYKGSESTFPNSSNAFDAYVSALKRQDRQEMPEDWEEEVEMGMSMLDYFENYWLSARDPLKTLVVDGIPQIEVNFLVDVPFPVKEYFPDSPYDSVVYSGTIDRVIIADDGRIWLVDYKTAKMLKQSHFKNDPQVLAYTWAATQLYREKYGLEVAGMIWWQFLKTTPKGPRILQNGSVSTASNMRTSRPLYKAALIDAYGSVEKSPQANRDYLDRLSEQESDQQDKFIRRDWISVNQASIEAEGAKILMEMEDMLNPKLPLYPNPTFLCGSMCSFYEECLSMDDGSDWEGQLESNTQQRSTRDESWRVYMRTPEEIRASQEELQQTFEH